MWYWRTKTDVLNYAVLFLLPWRLRKYASPKHLWTFQLCGSHHKLSWQIIAVPTECEKLEDNFFCGIFRTLMVSHKEGYIKLFLIWFWVKSVCVASWMCNPLKTEFLLNNIQDSVRTSQETHYVFATETSRLMLFRETVAVYCENHMEHTNILRGQNAEF
jgi:hypothetical protein